MATATQSPPSQQAPPNQTATLAALTVLLLSGVPLAIIVPPAIALLAPLGITAEAVTEVLSLFVPHQIPLPNAAPATALGHTIRTDSPRSAAYVLNAALRLSQGGSLDAERRYLSQHLQARRARTEVAHRVDAAGRMFGPLLGWRAVMDSRTTPACRAANGNNFHFDRPPLIGYPGSLHGSSCRCLPSPPYPDGRMVDEVVTTGP